MSNSNANNKQHNHHEKETDQNTTVKNRYYCTNNFVLKLPQIKL